jgi:serine-type D-Ala-D-Ala carboxypeptidase
MVNQWEKRLTQKLQTLPPGVTPGLKIQVYDQGRKRVDLSWGKTWAYYDLASLTKILFTTLACMNLVAEKKLDLKKPVTFYLPWLPFEKVKVRDLLRHRSGLHWWQPYYKKISQDLTPDLRYAQLFRLLREGAWRAPQKTLYSDLDFFVLGAVLEAVEEKPLFEIWSQMQAQHSVLQGLHFNRLNQPTYKTKTYAPTEKCPWRKKTLQGEVHDDNAWALGGVAGLFGRIEDVASWALALRATALGRRGAFKVSPPIVHQFLQRAVPVKEGDWTLGFMLPTRGAASCGQYFSEKTVGHTGFTGTSLWWDPKQDRMVILLSNRVHPHREPNLLKHFRPLIHDWVWETENG